MLLFLFIVKCYWLSYLSAKIILVLGTERLFLAIVVIIIIIIIVT